MHEPHKIKAKSTRKLAKGKVPLIPNIQLARYLRVVGRFQKVLIASEPASIFQFYHDGKIDILNRDTINPDCLFRFTVKDSKINFAVRPFERYKPGLMPRHKTTTIPKPWNYNKKPVKVKPQVQEDSDSTVKLPERSQHWTIRNETTRAKGLNQMAKVQKLPAKEDLLEGLQTFAKLNPGGWEWVKARIDLGPPITRNKEVSFRCSYAQEKPVRVKASSAFYARSKAAAIFKCDPTSVEVKEIKFKQKG